MKFDDFISKAYEDLGIIQEEAQTSNVVKDFFKNLKAISKGGKPSSTPTITLKDPSKVESLKKLTIPTYDVAEKELEAEKKKNPPTTTVEASNPFTNNFTPSNSESSEEELKQSEKERTLRNRIAKNTFDVFNSQALANRGTELSVTLYDLITKDPKVKTGEVKGRTFDPESEFSFPESRKMALEVLKPAIDAGVLKWEETKELSPQDLFNRLVNASAKGVGKAVNWVTNLDTGFAKM